jgi:serine/threonine protein kinase
MLAGKYPFEEATSYDKQYRHIINKNYQLFWKKKVPISEACKKLLEKMLAYIPNERITISEVADEEWF